MSEEFSTIQSHVRIIRETNNEVIRKEVDPIDTSNQPSANSERRLVEEQEVATPAVFEEKSPENLGLTFNGEVSVVKENTVILESIPDNPQSQQLFVASKTTTTAFVAPKSTPADPEPKPVATARVEELTFYYATPKRPINKIVPSPQPTVYPTTRCNDDWCCGNDECDCNCDCDLCGHCCKWCCIISAVIIGLCFLIGAIAGYVAKEWVVGTILLFIFLFCFAGACCVCWKFKK